MLSGFSCRYVRHLAGHVEEGPQCIGVYIESVALASVTVGQVRWGNDPFCYDAGLHPVTVFFCLML